MTGSIDPCAVKEYPSDRCAGRERPFGFPVPNEVESEHSIYFTIRGRPGGLGLPPTGGLRSERLLIEAAILSERMLRARPSGGGLLIGVASGASGTVGSDLARRQS
jgi:hypothetical protein